MNHHTASMNDSALCIPFRILVFVLLVLLSNYSHVSFAQDASPTISLSQEERTWLENNSEVTLGYADSQEPQLIVNSDGSYSGIVVDLLDELNQRLGTSFKLAAFPIKELFAKAQSKGIDGILNLNPSYAERLEMLKTIEYFEIFPALFTRRDLVFNKPEDIPGKTVAIIDKLYFSEKIIKEYEGQVTIKRVKSALEGLQSIQNGEADIFIGVSHNSYFISKYQLYDVAVKYIYTDWKEKTVIAVRPDWPVLVSILNKGLRSFSDIELKQIVARWVQLPEPELMDILSGEDRDWLAAHPNIVLGYTDAFEPEVIVNPDGSHSGILVDFLDELNRRLGTRITLRIDSIPGLLQKATNKEVDGILEIHPEYADKLGLLKSIGYLRAYPAVFARKNVSFAGPDDFAGKKIAIIDKVYFTEKMVREYGDQATILRVKDAIQGMKSVSEGDSDLYIGVSFNSYYITKYQLFDVVTKYIFRDFPDKFGMAVRPDWPELVPILNKGISSFSQNDIDAMVAKWVHLPQQEITVELTPEEQAWLKAHQPIRLGFKGEYPPYLMTGEKNLQSGILDDLRDELSLKLGVDIVIAEFKTFTDLLQASEKKEIDAVYTIMPSRAKKRGLLPTEVFLRSYAAIFTRQGERVAHLDDVIGKTVAMVKDMNFVLRILKPYLEQVTIVAVDTPADGMRLLSDGKVDMFIGTSTNSFMVNKFRIGGISQAYIHTDEGMPFAMGVRPDRPELVTVLNKGLAHIGQRGIETIVARWLKIQEPEERVQLNATERAWLDQNHTVRVRAAEWPPYFIIKENEPPRGITIDYLELITKRTGINFEYEVTRQPFAEFLKSMKEGQGPDMTAIIAQSTERKEYLSFSTPYIFAPYVIFAREQNEIFLDINDLAGKTVAVVKGHVMKHFLEKDFPEIELLLFDNDEQALRALSTGNADTYIGNLTVSTHIIQKRGLSNLRVVASTPYGDQILSMGNRKDWPELTSVLNKALASITEEEKTAIQNKYIALKYEQGLDREKVIQWILILVLISIAILLLFVFWNWQLRRKVGVRTADLEAEIVERKQVVAALLDSEEKFRGLVEQSPLSIQILNLDGQTLQVNKAWQELWGISDEDLPEVLKEYNVLKDEEARKLGLTPLIKKAFKGEIVTLPVIEYDASSTMGNLELEHVEANKRWVQARLYPIRNSKGEVLNVVDIEEDITARKLADNKILDYQQRLKALASQLTIAEEKERRRLAAELHDHVGQSLVFSRIQLSGLMEQTADQGFKESIDEVSRSLQEIIKNTRELVFDLSSPLLNEVGLSAATSQWLSKDIGEKYGLETEFIDNSKNVIYDNEMNSLLFRNIRELLINVVKHAYAKKVRVCFENHEDNLVITVEDNGIGFSANRADDMAASTDGFGLFSIQERLDDVGGALEIGSPPDKGCRVTITVPITI